jgi:hypothetical protein
MEKMKMVDADGNNVNGDGKTVGDIKDTNIIQGITKMYMYSDMSMSWNISGSSGSSSGQGEMKQMQSSFSNPTEPCTWSNYVFTNECAIYENTNSTNTAGGQSSTKVSLKKLIFKKGLTESQTGFYYTNGTVDFAINNWTGTMSYGADPSQRPAYTATNGADTIAGTYGISVGTKLSLLIKSSVRKVKILR